MSWRRLLAQGYARTHAPWLSWGLVWRSRVPRAPGERIYTVAGLGWIVRVWGDLVRVSSILPGAKPARYRLFEGSEGTTLVRGERNPSLYAGILRRALDKARRSKAEALRELFDVLRRRSPGLFLIVTRECDLEAPAIEDPTPVDMVALLPHYSPSLEDYRLPLSVPELEAPEDKLYTAELRLRRPLKLRTPEGGLRARRFRLFAARVWRRMRLMLSAVAPPSLTRPVEAERTLLEVRVARGRADTELRTVYVLAANPELEEEVLPWMESAAGPYTSLVRALAGLIR